jgi:hypothetical protein
MNMAEIHIQDTSTGETRTYNDKCPWSEYMWTDGNFGCDCNRHLFFERAIGNEPDDAECGETRYLISVPSEGYDEFGQNKGLMNGTSKVLNTKKRDSEAVNKGSSVGE